MKPTPHPHEIVLSLARVTALFQARAIAAHMGLPLPTRLPPAPDSEGIR